MTVVPYDEKDLCEGDCIIRRINPEHHLVWDENKGCRRVSTKAFSPSSVQNGGMSVDIEKKILNAGIEPQEYVATPVFTGAVQFTAGAARSLSLWVGYDPLPDNPHHGEVWGSSCPNRFSRRQRKGLLKASKWYIQIENAVLS